MKLRNLGLFLILLPILFVGCKKDETPTEPEVTIDESKLLVEYLESTTGGDFMNTTAPAIITADDVFTYVSSKPDKIYIMDIRSATDFETKGHIAGSVNVAMKDIVTKIKSINTASYEKIVVTCYSGQTSGYAVSLLRLLGYSTVFSLKWGMSSWNASCASSWSTSSYGNNYTGFITTETVKAAAGNLPTLNTGKKTGKEILEARVEYLLANGAQFDDIKIAWNTVTGALSNYYIVNYWAKTDYDKGHLPGAIQYTPKTDFKSTVNLKTLPTNKSIVIYCYTGQTSSQVATILKVLGYDAKTLLFGVNALNYDWMKTNGVASWFNPATEIKSYAFVTGK
jgi:rhodanese-related sulfurtransferase